MYATSLKSSVNILTMIHINYESDEAREFGTWNFLDSNRLNWYVFKSVLNKWFLYFTSNELSSTVMNINFHLNKSDSKSSLIYIFLKRDWTFYPKYFSFCFYVRYFICGRSETHLTVNQHILWKWMKMKKHKVFRGCFYLDKYLALSTVSVLDLHHLVKWFWKVTKYLI